MTDADIIRLGDRVTNLQAQIDTLTKLVHQLQDRYYLFRDEFLAHEQRPAEVK